MKLEACPSKYDQTIFTWYYDDKVESYQLMWMISGKALKNLKKM